MTINILTLFPEYFESILKTSILARAVHDQKITIKLVNIREFATDKHKVTDDRPYGGGPGMVVMVEPIDRALQSLNLAQRDPKQDKVVLTSAKGDVVTQPDMVEFANLNSLTIICGHYEGVDERVTQYLVDQEVSIGEFVLTGGEPAAAVMVDAVSRLQPGVLGNEESNQGESHHQPGFLAPPTYTRPASYKGWNVPEVLLSGDHAAIEEWKHRMGSGGTNVENADS